MSHYKITYEKDSAGNDVLRYTGDAQGIVDHCADYARGVREGGKGNDLGIGMRKMMEGEPVAMMEICRKYGLDYFDPAVWEILKGRDYSRFRTREDKLYFKDRSRQTFLGKK